MMDPWVKHQIAISAIVAAVVLAAALVMLVCGGCAVVKIETPRWNARAYTLFKTIEIPAFEVNGTNGEVVTKGTYRSGSDIEKAGTLIGTAVKAAGYGK